MNISLRRTFATALSVIVMLGSSLPVLGADVPPPAAIQAAAAYVTKTVSSPQVGSTGGEWAVLGLVRAGLAPQGYEQRYLQNLHKTLTAQNGVLSTRKYTEYARVVLALTALGQDPRQVAGYDLLAPLENLEQVQRQGINGPIFALLALDCGGYDAPAQLRDAYVDAILSAQLPDGGWTLSGDRADPDLTAQALQALAPYPQAEQAVEHGASCLDALWTKGAFLTLESHAQAVITYTTLDLQPPQALVSALLSFQLPQGGFAHLKGGKADQMASEQGLCALASLSRYQTGQSPLYQMNPAADTQAATILPPILAVAALSPWALWTAPLLPVYLPTSGR